MSTTAVSNEKWKSRWFKKYGDAVINLKAIWNGEIGKHLESTVLGQERIKVYVSKEQVLSASTCFFHIIKFFL